MAQKESGDEYLAGMWRRDIELQLIWSYPSASYLQPRMADYRGPSWSWASSCPRNNVGVFYEYPRRDDTNYRFLTHVQEAHVTLEKAEKSKAEIIPPILEIESLTDEDDH
ncbi:hypothetical protein HYALB_00000154 [Hymenoscyphus albidus]|uniref:Uncharacterized protein n=1 Tax=Hymenoscyphus albidus TaxID=595503 RepID=A0A9N9LIV2_9HELO|nr:hypothetical protein HYALB_00000154 [Hymenoscyphus albidus]